MNTTLVFVELLAAGALAVIALMIGIGGLEACPPTLCNVFNRNDSTVTIVGLALAYPLGIMIDGVADRLFQHLGSSFKAKYNLEAHHTVFTLASTKERWNDFYAKYFEYNRVRTRVVRSFLLNTFLMLAAGMLSGILHDWGMWIFYWCLIWSVLAGLAWWSLRELRDAWFRQLAIAWGVWGSAPIA